jgi:hypothetical protein
MSSSRPLPPAALVVADPSSRPTPAPMSTSLRKNACGTATGTPQPTVIVADRWPFRCHYLTTFRDVAEHRARLQLQYGACEWVCVGQDSAEPEIQFRVPNPLVLVDGQCFAFPMDMACIDGSDDDDDASQDRAA